MRTSSPTSSPTSALSSARPLVNQVLWIALAFALAVAALLVYLSVTGPTTPTADRYITDADNRPDPFRLRGCIGLNSETCAAQDLSKRSVPLPHADYLLSSLANYTAAKRGHSPNTVRVASPPDTSRPDLSTPLTQGRHLSLTLDPAVQDPAQTTAACYAGDPDACQRCTWCDTHNAFAMYEKARVRSIGILVLDAKTGAIEAAASAYTPCYEQQQKGESPATHCPVLPNTLLPRPDRLGNQALEQTAKPGSLSKIIIALALRRVGLSASEEAQMSAILTHSRTAELVDIVMCKAKGFDTSCAQTRLSAIADMAGRLDWSGRQADTLSAGQLPSLRAPRFTARIAHHANGTRMTQGGLLLDANTLRGCSVSGWQRCAGGRDVTQLLPELFGTGEALASPFGVCAALLQVAAAVNGSSKSGVPHLVHSAQDDQGHTQAIQAQKALTLSPAVAQAVTEGLSHSTTLGTANSACLAAAKALPGGLLPCVRSTQAKSVVPLRIAGKTGTPIFSADISKTQTLTLPEWHARCTRYTDTLRSTPENHRAYYALKNEVAKCNMSPTKWYAFLVSAPGHHSSKRTWNRIVVVLVERNWNAVTQKIDSPNDSGSNVAAEAGLAPILFT